MESRILVIDDEDVIRQSFLLALEDIGVRVDTSAYGEEGIELHRNNGYDLIFIDMKMPGMNGAETLQEIRKMDQNVPIYIITAFFHEFYDDLKKFLEAGVHFDLLKKPVDSEQIQTVVSDILGYHKWSYYQKTQQLSSMPFVYSSTPASE